MNRFLRTTGWVLIALGVVILEFAAYEVFGTSLVTHGHQKELRKEFQAEVANPAVTTSPAPGLRDPHGPRAIALLKIPKIDVDVIVVEGTSLADLVYGPGHYANTSKIGALGSSAIAGHRTGWGSPFLNLDKIGSGDKISLETPDGTVFQYEVTGSRVVGANAAWVLKGNPDTHDERQLTLTTCTPKFTSRERLIVWAKLVGTEKAT